jgi:hypothetical protein
MLLQNVPSLFRTRWQSQTSSNFPLGPQSGEFNVKSLFAISKLQVTKSWLGPLTVGSLISAGPQPIATGACPPPYPFHIGDEVPVFSRHYSLPPSLVGWPKAPDVLSWADQCWLIAKEKASKEISILDRLSTGSAP